MIHVVDYGLGNIQAFNNVYKQLGLDLVTAATPDDLVGARRVILPGVGAFDHAMILLRSSGMLPILEDLVQAQKIPVLGVCVGMQMLANGSDEGVESGLGWVPGRVRRISSNPAARNLPTPHMGWNDVTAEPGNPLFQGLKGDARFYFLHSYYFECVDPSQSSAESEYGFTFSCAVRNDSVFGVQFHPEKSHHWGVELLKNFASL